jgi:hypothetical protein
MIMLQTRIVVPGLTGRQITDFLMNCDDEIYRRWWPGTHLALHTIKRFPDGIGNTFYMDEYVGTYRIKMNGVVTGLTSGRTLEWRFKKLLVLLPVWLLLELVDTPAGVEITHTLRAGYKGFGRILDPAFRMYFSKKFAEAMDEHARIEFPKLQQLLN